MLSSSVVAQSIVYYYDHMNLIYSFECFLIIADTKIKRHEKVRTINFFMALNFCVCDYLERNKFQKQRSMPLNVIGPGLFEHFYIIKSGIWFEITLKVL